MHTILDTGKSTGVDTQVYGARNTIQHEGRHKDLCTRYNVSRKYLNNVRWTATRGTCVEKERCITFQGDRTIGTKCSGKYWTKTTIMKIVRE